MSEKVDLKKDDQKDDQKVVKKQGLFKKCKNCEKLKNECEEYKVGWQRALADYKNLQKEISEQRGQWAKMSELQILEEFIPVYDNFKKAFASKDSKDVEADSWAMGISFIMKQFGEVLKLHNVIDIKTVGEKFDPKFHEAVGEESLEEKEQGEILKEIDSGYLIGDKVVKVARVIISK